MTTANTRNLMNYTTTVPVPKTVSEIQAMLTGAGAHAVTTLYDAGAATGLLFVIATPWGDRHYRLPVKVDAVQRVLGRSKIDRRYRSAPQAERVAWRIARDWLDAQLALLRTEMASLDEVMMPWMLVDPGVTAYERYREQAIRELNA